MPKKNLHLAQVLEINLAMLFMSTSGVLGRYVQLPPVVTICVRALLASILLYGYCRYKNISLRIAPIDRMLLGVSGVFFCIHYAHPTCVFGFVGSVFFSPRFFYTK